MRTKKTESIIDRLWVAVYDSDDGIYVLGINDTMELSKTCVVSIKYDGASVFCKGSEQEIINAIKHFSVNSNGKAPLRKIGITYNYIKYMTLADLDILIQLTEKERNIRRMFNCSTCIWKRRQHHCEETENHCKHYSVDETVDWEAKVKEVYGG